MCLKKINIYSSSTRNGVVKRTPVSEFANIRSNGLIALTLRGDDELIGVKMTNGDENIVHWNEEMAC